MKLVIRKVVLNQPHLFMKRTPSYGSTSKFDTIIIISKDDKSIIEKIKKEIETASKIGNFTSTDELKLPLKDGDADFPGDKLYHNSYYMYASSVLQPSVVDHKLNELLLYDEVKSGTYANVSVEFAPYKFQKNTVDFNGVSCKLQNVQILPLKSRLLELKPKPQDDFKVENYDNIDNDLDDLT